jgi:hypothetical protein
MHRESGLLRFSTALGGLTRRQHISLIRLFIKLFQNVINFFFENIVETGASSG